MKMLRCRKCGAAVISDESLIQAILDLHQDAVKRAKTADPQKRLVALAEAAEYKSMYRALMHNISNKDYAEAVTPYVLKALVDEIKLRGFMTEAEITACYDKGRMTAKIRKENAEKEIRRIYGEAQKYSALPYRDPTANKAVYNVDKRKGGGTK